MDVKKIGLIVNGTLRVHPGDIRTFSDLLRQHVEVMRRNPDVCYYSIAKDVVDPALFHAVEGWTSREALAAHNKSGEHHESVRRVEENVRVIDRDMRVYTVVDEERV